MPNFALSRRQRGFESRWRHKIKSSLTGAGGSMNQALSVGSPLVDMTPPPDERSVKTD
jgi:hypothetical protein